MKRILMLGLVLALLGVMVISSAAFAKGPCGDGDGSQAHLGAANQHGETYGPGDGTGPKPGGEYGPGPYGTCQDLNDNGICDCKE
jgi:hypothetical protein